MLNYQRVNGGYSAGQPSDGPGRSTRPRPTPCDAFHTDSTACSCAKQAVVGGQKVQGGAPLMFVGLQHP